MILKEQIYDAGQIQINYAVGPANGSPLLLLHGVASNWQSFLPLITGLGGNHQIYAMDLRGHGLSGRLNEGYRLVDYSADVLQFIEDELGHPTVIVGHSIGALIAIYAAAKLQQSIRAIILLDPPLIYR